MKIKFLDTSEIIEVTTASQLANTKFFCKSRSEIKAIEDLGFVFCTQEDIYFKGATDYTISLWFDLEYSYGHGYDEERKPFREFEFISPETETALIKDIQTIQGVSNFIQAFDKVNPEPAIIATKGKMVQLSPHEWNVLLSVINEEIKELRPQRGKKTISKIDEGWLEELEKIRAKFLAPFPKL